MLKTVQDIIDHLKHRQDQGSRLVFWENVQRNIDNGSYGYAMENVLDHKYDDDFPTQIRCVAESIAQHKENQ